MLGRPTWTNIVIVRQGARRLLRLYCLILVSVSVATGMACDPGGSSPPPPTPSPVVKKVGYFSITRRESLDPTTGLPREDRVPLTLASFRQGLAQAGLELGRDVEIVYGFVYEGEGDQTDSVAADLIAQQLDVIVATGPVRVRALLAKTDTIPIVMVSVSDPVQNGLVKSLSEPPPNLTGLAQISSGVATVRLEWLQQAVPGLSRVAVLSVPEWDRAETPRWRQWQDVQRGAEPLGLDVWVEEVRSEPTALASAADFEAAIARAQAHGAEAIYPLSDSFADVLRKPIAESALAHGLASVYYRSDFADDGGFMAYGENTAGQYRRAATDYVARIIKSATARQLPIQQADEFDFVINLRTARQLGIAVPESVLSVVNRVVD